MIASLPNVMQLSDDENVRSVRVWENSRRPEIIALLRNLMYGHEPAPDSYEVSFETIRSDSVLSLLATRKLIRVRTDTAHGNHAFIFELTIPKSVTAPSPGFLHLALPDERDKTELLVSRGYCVAKLDPRAQVSEDFEANYRNGIISRFCWNESTSWRAISAWAWSASKVMDYLQLDPEVDDQRIALVGLSRLGKSSLWGGAIDTRFAMVVAAGSGPSGAKLARRFGGGNIAKTTTNFPHWFLPAYASYANREYELPFDQHMLLSLVAPRCLVIASASEDANADPKGEFASMIYAQPVFKLYGSLQKTWKHEDWPEKDNVIENGNMQYQLRNGSHGMTMWDWEKFLNFADKKLLSI